MNAYVLSSLRKAPTVAERILRGMEPTRFDERRDPERFTVREAIAHLADWEPIWLERFNLCNAQPGATIRVYDEGQVALEGNYGERDVYSEAARYVAGREQLIALFDTFGPEDWQKAMNHPERGILTLGEFGGMILGHDVYHLEHFSQYLFPA